MRLVNTETFELEEFYVEDNIPPYAVLSHTWGDVKNEVTYQDWSSPQRQHKTGFKKIQYCCDEAKKDNIQWAWVDTCCIDKTNLTELSESINSMFRWYKNAEVCYAYLSDLDDDNATLPNHREGRSYPDREDDTSQSVLSGCRWFQRGWTLQELIAPPKIIFFSRNWNQIGPHRRLVSLISSITGIGIEVINHDMPISAMTVAARMSWASRRKTTRTEDMAYCLLGIFEVNMPLLYGEGDRAFLRLQEEIMKVHGDLSLFAWGLDRVLQPMDLNVPHPVHTLGPGKILSDVINFSGLFATSPKDFEFSDNISKFTGYGESSIDELADYPLPPMVMNGGLRIELTALCKEVTEKPTQSYTGRQLCSLAYSNDLVVFAVLDCSSIRADGLLLAIPLIAWDDETFGRAGKVVYVDIMEYMDEYEEKHGSWSSHVKELQVCRRVLFIKAPPQSRGKRHSKYPTAFDTGLSIPEDVRAEVGWGRYKKF